MRTTRAPKRALPPQWIWLLHPILLVLLLAPMRWRWYHLDPRPLSGELKASDAVAFLCCALTARLAPLRPGVCGILSLSVHSCAASCPPPSIRVRHLVPLRPCVCGILSPSVHASAASCPFLSRLPQPLFSFLPLLLQVLLRCNLFFYFLQPRTASSPAFAPLAEGTLTVHCCTTQHLRLFVRSSAVTHLFVVCRVSFPQIW